MLAEAVRLPDLACAFYENGPTRVLSLLASYLQEKTAAGVMSVSDPEIAAEQFIQMMISERQRRALLGIEPTLSSAEITKRIDQSVALFLGFVQYSQGAS